MHRSLRMIALVLLLVAAPASVAEDALATRPTADLLAFHVKDKDFRPIEVAPWVYTNTLQAFVPVDAIDEAAGWGVNVVHGAGPDLYSPLMKDDPKSGPPPESRAAVTAYVAKARSHKMKVIVGVNPGAPVNLVKAHPEWMQCPTPDVAAVHAKVKLDLAL